MAGEKTEGAVVGMVHKSTNISTQEITDKELRAINKYTLEPLKAEDLFVFRAVLCDNDVDRDFERFDMKTLNDLSKLFLGKTVIKDHMPKADNQVARIYATELVQSDKTLECGELYTQLVAKCYMIRTAGNTDLIAEINGGIKKEGSVSCSVKSMFCSICGLDNRKSYCSHFHGRYYDTDIGKKLCTFTLSGAKDAYEFSLVSIPAQKAAGVSKSYTGETVYEKDIAESTALEGAKADAEKVKELILRTRLGALQSKIKY